ncbi:MAG: preprotein translocase subunit SecG [Spirochaetia bacterium]|nr:preprotein translocase subunit SecG [Spirochaetia bacterium]
MGVFGIILLVLFVIVCIILVLLVVVQGENSQGLGGIFGGASDTTFGTQSGNIMTKITYIVGASFLVLAFGIGFLSRTPDTPNLLDSFQNDTVVEQTENWWNEPEPEPESE